MEGEALLDRILENTPPLEPLRVEPKSSHEEVSTAESEPLPSIQRPSPEPKTSNEDFHPSDFPFEDELFKDFGNTHKIFMSKEATNSCHSS